MFVSPTRGRCLTANSGLQFVASKNCLSAVVLTRLKGWERRICLKRVFSDLDKVDSKSFWLSTSGSALGQGCRESLAERRPGKAVPMHEVPLRYRSAQTPTAFHLMQASVASRSRGRSRSSRQRVHLRSHAR